MSDMNDPILAGIDLGATNLRVAVAGGDSILARRRLQTPRGPSGEAVTDAIVETLDSALEEASVEVTSLDGIGVGTIGPLDSEGGAVISTPNLPDEIGGIRLAGPLADHTGAPVRIENDGVAGLIGERADMEDPPENMMYLTLSSGIGAGIAIDGRVLRGWGGNVGEIGHFVVDPDGDLPCGCGREGHWEAYAAGANVPDYARSLFDEFTGETDLPVGEADFTAEDVFELAGDDVFADLLVHRIGQWNAQGVANVIHAFAPSLVSIGGSVALENPELVIEPIRDRLPSLITTRVPEIRETPLGSEAVLNGALELASGRYIA